MRVSIVFPPSICLPNQIYYALPILAGALRRAGHEPHAVDLNLVSADLLLDERRAEDLLATSHRLAETEWSDGDAARAKQLRTNLDVVAPMLRRGESFKHALRDPQRFYDQSSFHESFWGITDALGSFYSLDEIISPFRDDFVADMVANQEADAWSAMGALWDDGLLDEVLVGDPQLVGISLAFPEQSVEAVRLMRKLRARDPSIRIVVGGPLVSGFRDKWLGPDAWLLEHCDYVVLGDGETAFVELCDALEGRGALEDVRNLVYRDARGTLREPFTAPYLENMDELPVPDFAAADMARYFLPEPIYPLMTSRGCYWGKCTFCSIGWRENYRMASKEKLRADVLAVTSELGGRFIQLQDSSLPPKAGRYLAEVVCEEQVEAHWVTGMKFETCFKDRAYCDLLHAGGCRSLQMGFESSDQRLLDAMCKGYRHADLPLMLRNLRDAGISAELLWFIGFPSQSRGDVLDTAMYLYENRDLFGLTSFVGDYGLHPDTEVFDRPQDFGVTIVGQKNGYCTYVVAEGMSMDEAAKLKQMLTLNNNRTLTCNGSHLPHLAVGGIDLSELGRPMAVPPEVVEYCAP